MSDPERIEEALRIVRERIEFGALERDHITANGALDFLAAALREAQAEIERLQRKIDAEIPWTKDGAYEALQAENERLREALENLDAPIQWIAKTNPKVIREMPSDLFWRFQISSSLLAPADEAKPW